MSIQLLFVVLQLTSLSATSQHDAAIRPITNEMEGSCEDLTINSCSNMGYTMTSVPNFRGHTSQVQAERELNDFLQLTRTNCSPFTGLFLCAFYAPICFINPVSSNIITLKPCRFLCESVRAGCRGTLEGVNLSWPSFFNCSLDTFTDGLSCFGPSSRPTATTIETTTSYSIPTSSDITITNLTAIEESSTIIPESSISAGIPTVTTAIMSSPATRTLPPTVVFPVDVNGSGEMLASFYIVLISDLLLLTVAI